MARTADHEARRRQISESAAAVALAEGLGGVTVARVARHAGVSVGLVQHYFSTKELLIQRAFADMSAATDGRVALIVENGEAQGLTIREMVVLALAELLPVDDPRHAESIVRAELRTLSARDDILAAVARRADRDLRARLRHVIDNAKRCGETPPSANAHEVADELWATTAGIAAAMLVDSEFPGIQLLRRASALAFPHPCRRHDRPQMPATRQP